MDLMYGCGSDMDLSIQELFEQDMQNEINRMMSSDLGIDDLIGDSTPLFQGLTEDGFDEFDLCFESSSSSRTVDGSTSKGADLFDPTSGGNVMVGGSKKGLGAVVNVPLKSQVTNSRSNGATHTVTIIKGSNTSQSTARHQAVTIKQNALGRPNVHRFGAQTKAIVTSGTQARASPPPMQYIRVMTTSDTKPNLAYDEAYGGVMVDPSSVIPASIGSTGSSSIGSETDPECLATDEEESESELMQGSVAAWIIPDAIPSRTPSPEPDFDEPQFITTQVGSHVIVEGPPTKKRKQKHHEPKPHTDGKIYPKPAFSYSCLIAMALKNSKTGSLPVSEIYKFMCDHFPYFKSAPSGWKNSVRHNLSLNKCFEKIEKPGNNGARKGCLWALNPQKIHKMDEEVQKWSRKDPLAIRRAMSDPENLELIEKGELKRDYSGAGSDDDEEEDFSEPATPLTPGQVSARRSRTNSSDSTLEGTTAIVAPVVTTVSQVHAALQRSASESKSQQIQVKREDSTTSGTTTTVDLGTITNIQGNYVCHTPTGNGTYTLSFANIGSSSPLTPIIIRRTPTVK